MTDPVGAATRATYAVFAECGVGLSAFVSRLPQIRDHLHLSAGALGVILLAAAGGALAARPFSRTAVRRLGRRGTVTWTSVVFGAGLALSGISYLTGVPTLVAGLLLMGFAGAMCDVAMNLHGALVEQRLGRSIMPRFHAGYSVGTVASALAGVLMVLARIPVLVHLAAFGVLVAIVIPWSARGFLADPAPPAPAPARTSAASPTPRPINFWREPRTILIG
ncbi:MAG: MFS transporter, partial [Pseudonocardiaceae bacterium]